MFYVIRNEDVKIIKRFEDFACATALAEDMMDRNQRAYSVRDEDTVLVNYDPEEINILPKYKIKPKKSKKIDLPKEMMEDVYCSTMY